MSDAGSTEGGCRLEEMPLTGKVVVGPPSREEATCLIAQREAQPSPVFTGLCPIREHTGDGAYVGRCEHATYDGFCPRHGAIDDYPTSDDREVRVEDRRRADA